MTTEVKEQISKVKSLLDTRDKWCQNNYRLNQRKCLASALYEAIHGEEYNSYESPYQQMILVEGGSTAGVITQAYNALYPSTMPVSNICRVNNAVNSFEELHQVLDKATELAAA